MSGFAASRPNFRFPLRVYRIPLIISASDTLTAFFFEQSKMTLLLKCNRLSISPLAQTRSTCCWTSCGHGDSGKYCPPGTGTARRRGLSPYDTIRYDTIRVESIMTMPSELDVNKGECRHMKAVTASDDPSQYMVPCAKDGAPSCSSHSPVWACAWS